ncbi:N-acetylmuramoyl-L-alanine amidase [Polyangium aurulentum]|uniref:N-acetylmuramoyl-L-alanine amidase n=1 Tax=Polyangium aurulentum TaxID=2567896 RepID=UPI0010AEDDB0|nr:N-acetylmuramoyl-L-alanine amidase [Polyangium aurulentum]UQA56742.1 N-acetylmuramoyl-L-alanine amidase [Polyangium aurulentum]
MISRRAIVAGLAASAAASAALAWPLLRGPRPVAIPPPRFPDLAAPPLTPPALLFPAVFGLRRVLVDPGHGAPGNAGNRSSYCIDEQDFTLRAARALADRLRDTGHFDVRLARDGDARVDYRARVEDAARWGAEVFLSLHSDVRGATGERWSPEPGSDCPTSLAAPGFSVLWSDEGAPALCAQRHALARALARRMCETGFVAYGGVEYGDLYAVDPDSPGVFVDRHAPDQRIFVLRRTAMPSALIETHHALDPREARRWEEPSTHDAFAAAVAAALIEALGT